MQHSDSLNSDNGSDSEDIQNTEKNKRKREQDNESDIEPEEQEHNSSIQKQYIAPKTRSSRFGGQQNPISIDDEDLENKELQKEVQNEFR
ncbi:MAG: hypothetical protein EZS28_014414 [Streblomastix strix]|uniref:Uncharacterized protein n=1 Tax=Streblomastix strix TaxID=222440 RepID=A0A5J4W5M2_9EUKA|nr:MAG: hypothetical protein EZS28_014414 [Streblomastix strix]